MFTKNGIHNKLIYSMFIVIIYILLEMFIKVNSEMKANKSKIKYKTTFIIGKWQVLTIRGILLFISSYVILDLHSRNIQPPIVKKPLKKEEMKTTIFDQPISDDMISIF